jgi:hypothetical protein
MRLPDAVTQEYNRLCKLMGGKPPFGDCQLVALMVSRVVINSRIVQGYVGFEDGDRVEHFWIRSGNTDIDPLAADWLRIPVSYSVTAEVQPSEILNEYQGFIATFPEANAYSPFPLRWALKSELLT